MRLLLSLVLAFASVPVGAYQHAAKTVAPMAPVTLAPQLPTPLITAEGVRALAPVPVQGAQLQLQTAIPTQQVPAEQAAAITFDGALKKPAAPVAVAGGIGGLALPLAVKVPTLGVASYAAANALSVAFPLPQTYRTFKQGHARDFPVVRATLGAVGTILLGLINAPVLDKPFWGAMHIFVGVGMLAPYFLGKYLEKKKAAPINFIKPDGVKGLKAAFAQLKGDGALGRTLLLALPMLAASVAAYAGAAAFVPSLMASLTPQVADAVLLGLQLFKMALFIAVFAPDIMALIKGREPKGFTMGFNLVFFASVASFAAWGFTAAAAETAGPIRDQYLVLALRNLGESIAAALSIAAIVRAKRRKNK